MLKQEKNLNYINEEKDFKTTQALTHIYTNLVLGRALVEKYQEAVPAILHLGLVFDNIEEELRKVDEYYQLLVGITE